MTEFVTMPQPVVLGTGGLFAVQAGVPLSEAMGAAEAVGGGQDCSGAVWAVQHLLQMARALNSSIQSGFVAAQRGNDASGRA